jgi:hypothetical protein
MAAPPDKVGVQAFLGFAGYYRPFIHAFADVARTLTAMLSIKLHTSGARMKNRALRR